MRRIIHHKHKKNCDCCRSHRSHPCHLHSGKIEMEAGQLYYLEAVHSQRASSAPENFLILSLWLHQTPYTGPQTDWHISHSEHISIRMRYDQRREKQVVTFHDMENTNTTEITFTHAGRKAGNSVDFTKVTFAKRLNLNHTSLFSPRNENGTTPFST